MTRVLAIEPFYGGSHRAVLDGLIERSRHEYRLLTQPACFWKWRMRGSALTLAAKARALFFKPEIVLASDMLSLAEFKGLYLTDAPSILYMHENQLSYPAPASDARDVHFGFTNLSSLLCADQVAWNSNYHLQSFLAALPDFLKAMPDCRPKRVAERILEKSTVLYPGVDLASIDRAPIARDPGPPILLWNHRWEFDKRPEVFFEAVDRVAAAGVDFRLAVLGENFQAQPKDFINARERHSVRLAHMGYVEGRSEYVSWLRRSSVSVSVSDQENFGISAVEAAYAGARPLWPRRLSYPELIPESSGLGHLYSDLPDLVVKLKAALTKPADHPRARQRWAGPLRRFDWSELIGAYDDLIEQTAAATRRP